MAKSKQGSAVVTTGPQSPACVAGGDINITYDSVTTAIEVEDAWRKLLECFTYAAAERTAAQVLNPRLVKSQQDGSHIVQWISQKFSAIALSPSDSRAKTFIALRDQAYEAIQALADERGQAKFQQVWVDIGSHLLRLK